MIGPKFFKKTLSLGGSHQTINVAFTNYLKAGLPDISAAKATKGPVDPLIPTVVRSGFRQVIDMGAPEKSVVAFTGGQSESALSPHFFDLAEHDLKKGTVSLSLYSEEEA